MPHMFVNRPRLHHLTAGRQDIRAQFRWETINAVLYKLGGVVFIIGSILFFPRFEAHADLGAWVFFGGSLLYLVVTGHDMAEVRHYHKINKNQDLKAQLEYIAASSYLVGTLLFTVGSIFFLSTVGWTIQGAWCFILGSLLFTLGACINVLQIIQARTLLVLQLMNLTAVTFVVGSVLFFVASVPYLWSVSDPSLHRTLYAFLAWQYLIGSVLFLLGGVFNYWRAYVVIREALAAQKGNAPASPG